MDNLEFQGISSCHKKIICLHFLEYFSYSLKIKAMDIVQKKVSGQSDTITAAIFALSLICACRELISKYAFIWRYVNMNF